MENESYKISRIGTFIFEFTSVGTKPLLKRISFDEIEHGTGIYNLALGTVLENGSVNFRDSTNNGDVVKIFSTIVRCIKIFASSLPGSIIFFSGNTDQKTRVYNAILRRYCDEFSITFNIFGVSTIDGNTFVRKFEKSESYSGFYLILKN